MIYVLMDGFMYMNYTHDLNFENFEIVDAFDQGNVILINLCITVAVDVWKIYWDILW